MNDEQASETQWSVTQLQHINRILSAFDRALNNWVLKKGEPPKLEEYLRECPESLREEVLKSLLAIELSFHRQRGQVAPLDHYLARFPQHTAMVSSVYHEVVSGHPPQPTVSAHAAPPPPAGRPHPNSPSPPSPSVSWYYLRNHVPVGPFTFEQLQRLGRAGDLRPKDLVCEESRKNWVEAGSIPALFGGLTEGAGKAPAPGQSIRDDYILLEMIGRGGMGEVYKAYRFSLKREVALKIIRHDRFTPLSPARQQQLLECFRKEMQRTANLRHDHIVSIHDTGDHNGLPFYTLDLVDTNLAKILHHGPLPGKKAAEFMEKVARAVEFAHGQHVIHRDLKPHNILLDKDKPLLADLGLAAVRDELLDGQDKGQIVGTPSYMAPEQARGDKVDHRADIYGLGATLYHLIAGRPPHQAPEHQRTLEQVVAAEPLPPRKLNPAIDRDLEAITLKCLEKDPEKRYATAGLLAEDLQRYLQGRTVSAKRPSLWERLNKWARREPIKAGLVGGIVTLLLIFFIYYMVSNRLLSAALDVARDEKIRAEKHAEDAKRSEEQATLERQRAVGMAEILGARVLNKHKQQFLDDPETSIVDLEKYRASLEKMLKERPLDPVKLDLAETLRGLANLYLQKQLRPNAIASLKQCVDLQEELSRNTPILKFELALNYLELGGLYGQVGKREEELRSDMRALELLKAVEAQGIKSPMIRRAQAEAHGLVGLDLSYKDDWENALAHQKKSISMLEELNLTEKGNFAFASFQRELGNAYQKLGLILTTKEARDATDALVYLKKAKAVFDGKGQFRKNLAEVNLGLGQAYVQLNQPEDALQPLAESHLAFKELLKELPEKSSQAGSLQQHIANIISYRGRAFQLKGNYLKAEELFKEGLAMREDMYSRWGQELLVVQGYNDLARLYQEEKKLAESLTYFDRAIKAQEDWVKKAPEDFLRLRTAGALWYNKGLLLFNAMKDVEALDCFQQAKPYEIQALKLTKGGSGYEKNLELTYDLLKKTQLRLNKLEDAFATVVETTGVWKNDPAKYLTAVRELATIQQRPGGEALLKNLLTVLENGLQANILTTERLRNEFVFERYRAVSAFAALLQKYEKP